MKEFVVEDFGRFLEIADTINTPFKFYELSESDVGEDYTFVRATVWLRSAFQTWEKDIQNEKLETVLEPLRRHGFTVAKIRETAIPIK